MPAFLWLFSKEMLVTKRLGLLLLALLFLALPAFAQNPQGLTVPQLQQGPALSDSDSILVCPGGSPPCIRHSLSDLKAYFGTIGPQINSIAVTPSSFVAEAGNANRVVGAFTAVVSSGSFGGDFGLATSTNCPGPDNAAFSITSSTLSINTIAVTVARTYSLCVRAVDANFGNSPAFFPVTVTGTTAPPAATINSVGASPSSFTAQAGNQNTTVGTLSTVVSSGTFAGTYALSTSGGCSGHGADNASFAITGATLKIGGSAVTTARTYAICLLASDAAYTNTPFPQQLTITGTSGVPTATITSVAATPATFAAQVGNAGATVGSLSTIVSTGSFAGTYALSTSGGCATHGADNASFAITGATLKLNTSDVLTARSYAICLLATDAGFANSPFPQQLTITGTGGPAATITSVSATPSSFTAAAGNATSTVGTLSAVVSSGTFSGTFALATGAGCDSTNNSSFAIVGSTLKIGSSDAFNGIAYHICVSATQSSFSNSPKLQPLTIQGNGPSLLLFQGSTVAPSASIPVTFAGGVGDTYDFMTIAVPGAPSWPNAGANECCFAYLNGNPESASPPDPQLTSGTNTLTGPSAPGTYEIRYYTSPGSSSNIIVATTPLIVSGTPQINSISLTPSSFTAQAGNATSTVGTLTASVSSGSFTGNFALTTGLSCPGTDNAKFTTSGTHNEILHIGASDITSAGAYNICVSATQGGFSNSPKLQQLTVTGNAGVVLSISSVSLSPSSFVAQSGNAGATVGQLSTTVSTGSFAGTYAFSTTGGCSGLGADNGLFTLTGATLKLHGTDVTSVRSYAICVTATDATYSNSPFPQGLTVNGIAVGSAITTVTFKNLSGATLPAGSPISMGQGFRYSDIMPGTHPLIRDASTHTALAGQQWNEISTWRENGGNGSWRHAVWAAWLPSSLTSGATTQFEFISTSGAYAESSHQPLTALCSGPAAHDLKIHLTDVRNQDDSVRDSGNATFRVCDNIANNGRDAPRHLSAGNVMDEYVVSGLFVYTSGHKDPLLYAQCNIDLFTKSSDGSSAGDVRWDCHVLSPWMNVAQGSAGNAGNTGPAGFTNDPQAISYRAEIDDGATNILDWSGLDATIASASNPVEPVAANCHGSNATYCLFVPTSEGANKWYNPMAVRTTCSGGCIGGLADGHLYYVYTASAAPNPPDLADARYVNIMTNPTFEGPDASSALNGSQGTGSTTFSQRIQHYHWGGWDTLDSSGATNWAPFGTTTRATRKVYPALTTGEKTYWEQTGLIIPLGLSPSYSTANLVDYFDGLGDTYNPMSRLNMMGTGGPGARSDIGISNEYSAKAFLTEAQADWDNARLASLAGIMHGPSVILNEATGRMPPLNNGPPTGPGGNGNGGSYTGLGAPLNQTHIPPGSLTGLADPTGKPTAATAELGYGFVYTGLDHMPGFSGFTYALFGDRHFLDIMQWRGDANVMQQEPGPGPELGQGHFRDNNARFTDGNTYHYWGLLTNSFQGRGNAWLMRDVVYPAAFGADDYPLCATCTNNPERLYFNDLITETGNYWPLWLNYEDGPGSVGYTGSLWPPSSDDSMATFKTGYLASTYYIMTTFLHAPMGAFGEMPMQKIVEGTIGGRMFGHVPTYSSITYYSEPSALDGDHVGFGGAIGPLFNGVDASDWGDSSAMVDVLPGGQLRLIDTRVIQYTEGDTFKILSGWNWGGLTVDQLPGTRWYSMTNINNSDQTFYLKCTSADHAAFPTQCPVAGQTFTGFTSGGSPLDNVNGLVSYKLRTAFDPGAGQGYLSQGYVPYMGQAASGLGVLGYDVAATWTDIHARRGNTADAAWNGDTPQYNWDRNVVVPGIPAVVTFSNQFPTLSCGATSGTVVTTLGLAHGNGNGPGAWTIIKASDPTHYAISGNNLITAGTIPCGASQMVQVRTTQSGGSSVIGEVHLHVNAGGGGGATIDSISLTPQTFVATSGNQGTAVGTLFAGVSSGSFGGTFALVTTGGCSGLGANNGLFSISGSTLNIGGSAITAAGAKAICVRATDGGFTNSPQYQAFTVTGTAGPSLVVNGGSTVTAGNPVSITLSNGLGNTLDWINIVPTGSGASVLGTWAYLNGSQTPPGSPVSLPATITLTAPAAGSYEIRYLEKANSSVFGTIGATTPLTVQPATTTSAPGPLAVLGSNSRLFKTPDGKGIYLTGFHTWTDFVSIASQGDSSFTQFADYESSRKGNLIRLWSGIGLLTAFNGDNAQHASPIAFNRSGTCCAADGGNKFDLNSYNATFFNQLKSDVEYAASKGMYVEVQMLYQYGGGVGFNELVFNGNNNINGTTTNENTAYTGGDGTTVSFVNAYIHHLLDTLGAEPNVLYEVSNEPSAANFSYENSIIVGVHSYEASHGYGPHPIGADMPSGSFGSSSGDFVIDQDFNVTPGVFSIGKPVLLDTDHTFGIGGGTDWWWQVFMNGNHPLSMDDMHGTGVAGNYDLGSGTFYAVEAENRAAIEQQRTLMGMVDMTAVVPHGDLASTGFALVDTAGHQYIVYDRIGETITVDLSSASGIPLKASWVNLVTGSFSSTTDLTGGSSSQTFVNPFDPTPATLLIVPGGGGGGGPPIINSITLSPSTFVATAPNANTTIGTLTTSVSAGSFSGTYTKTTGVNCPGADNASFTISGSTVLIAGASLTVARNYDICVAANDGNFSNSPLLQQLTINGGTSGCGSGPQLVTNKSTYAPGETVSITGTCGSSNPSDYVLMRQASGEVIGDGGSPFMLYLPATPSFTVTLPAPTIKADRDVQFNVKWYLNNTFNLAAQSPLFTVTKAIDPPAPVATLPVALAADPFVPDHVITVCLTGGCDFADPWTAMDSAHDLNWENVEIKISAGEYQVPPLSAHLIPQHPLHLWLKGLSPDGGKTRAHLFGTTQGGGNLLAVDFEFVSAGPPTLTIDNLELGPWNYWMIGPRDYRTWTMRNIYAHDSVQNLITSNSVDQTINFYNVVFVRSGGGDGPEHIVYMGEGGGHATTNVVNSVFAQAIVGHSFKERSQVINFTCSMFLQNIDNTYYGSETVDMDSGSPHFDKILSVNGDGSKKSWTDDTSWDSLRYGGDWESILSPDAPTVNNSTFVAQQLNSGHWFFTLGIPLSSHQTWSNNKFVWFDSASRQPGSGGTCQQSDTTGALYTSCRPAPYAPNTNDVTLDGSNTYFTSRASAGLADVGAPPHDWRDFLPWMPSGCTDPVGLVHVPAS